MVTQALSAPRFIRKTQLTKGEYRKNFHQIDDEILAAITSSEADQITPLMSKIYLRLITAPSRYWERDGVLRFEAEARGEEYVKAWAVLCGLIGVASATANKALSWMHSQGIIGYFSGKNGVGLRIFLNRAASSIGVRKGDRGEKILDFTPASFNGHPGSFSEPAFIDTYGDLETLDKDLNPPAPKNGADTKPVSKTDSEPTPRLDTHSRAWNQREEREVEAASPPSGMLSVDEIVARLKCELEPCVRSAAQQAAAQTATREIARTREWFETRALPKAVRVAQHETYDLLRKYGPLNDRSRRARADLEVGRATADSSTPAVAHELSPEEIRETAETCVALLEAQGKATEVTLSEISAEGGGWLLPADAPRVRAAAQRLMAQRREGK